MGARALAIASTLPMLAYAGVHTMTASRRPPLEPFEPTEAERVELERYSQPEAWFVERLLEPRHKVDGHVLDPKIQHMLEQGREESRRFAEQLPIAFSTAWGRRLLRDVTDRSWLLMTKVTAPMAEVEDLVIAGRDATIPIRVYRPDVDDGPLPVLVYHHGGGWVLSSIAASDRVCRLLANEAHAIVISVGYRLAPEHRYPAASDDGEDAFAWALEHAESLGGDPERVGVGGDSAGGHVAIDVALRRIAAGERGPVAMLLFYPGAGLPLDDPSYERFATGYSLDASFIEFILPRVFGDLATLELDDLIDPASSTDLRGMPPTIIETAGFDILRDCGRRFAAALARDDVPVHHVNRGSLTHSFLQYSAIVHDADVASTSASQLFGRTARGEPLPA